MSTNSSHENSEDIKNGHPDKEELLQEMQTKSIASQIVEEKMNKVLTTVKWVIGTLGLILAFFGWSTFTGMRDQISDQIKVSVSEQIREEISNQSILDDLRGRYNELQDNLILENLKLKVNLYNDGKQRLLADRDKDIIPKRYEAVLQKMIYSYDDKANDVINTLNGISLAKSYVEKDFYGNGFEIVKGYVDSAIKSTKDPKLKFACTKFLINFCFDETEKLDLIMDNLQKANDETEVPYLLPRIAFHLRSNNQNATQSLRLDFTNYCKEKIRKASNPLLLMSSYFSLLRILNAEGTDFNRVKKDFENQVGNGISKFPEIIPTIDFLMQFDFLFLSLNNTKEYKNLVAKFLCGIYKVNNGLNSAYLKGKLLELSNINGELYLDLFKNLLNDKSISDERLSLLYLFSVQTQQEASEDLKYLPICYLKNKDGAKIRVLVDLNELKTHDDMRNPFTINHNDSLFIQFERNIAYISNNE